MVATLASAEEKQGSWNKAECLLAQARGRLGGGAPLGADPSRATRKAVADSSIKPSAQPDLRLAILGSAAVAPERMVICCGACAGGGRVGGGDALELSGSAGVAPWSERSRMLSVGENGRSNGVEPKELGSHFDALQADVERNLGDARDVQVESAGVPQAAGLSFTNRSIEPAERERVARTPGAGESASARHPVFAMELALAA